VVGVVIVRPVTEHDVRLPVANEPRNGAAVLHRRLQLAVVDVEHLRGDAKNLGDRLDFRGPPARQGPTRLAPVPDVSIRDRDELDLVTESRPLGGGPGEPQLVVVGVRAKGDHPQLAVLGGGRRDGSDKRGERSRCKEVSRIDHQCLL
jgi:hypothetical protein